MTRIIAGSAGGRRIGTPRGVATRPTSDRVREALFSVIESWCGTLSGLRFLDLYAGSGAIGLEAWSRGAGVVEFVESDRRTSALIRSNATSLGFGAPKIAASPVAIVLASTPLAPFDIVFSDPPYPLEAGAVDDDLASLAAHDWVVPGGLVIVERATRGAAVAWPVGFTDQRSKKYGETTLHIAHSPDH
ncbi:16S rRNA (guanine(966)-N(2))-methyltransferase RsmD [soil metagenome]